MKLEIPSEVRIFFKRREIPSQTPILKFIMNLRFWQNIYDRIYFKVLTNYIADVSGTPYVIRTRRCLVILYSQTKARSSVRG